MFCIVLLQDLCDDLEAQEEQLDLVLREIALVSSVASPRVLEELSVDCGRLTDAVGRTKDMIRLKREEKDKGLLEVIQGQCTTPLRPERSSEPFSGGAPL